MKAPWLEIGPEVRTPGDGLTVTVKVVIDTPRKALAFAWDMARSISFANWWHRPLVFFGLLIWGFHHLTTREFA